MTPFLPLKQREGFACLSTTIAAVLDMPDQAEWFVESCEDEGWVLDLQTYLARIGYGAMIVSGEEALVSRWLKMVRPNLHPILLVNTSGDEHVVVGDLDCRVLHDTSNDPSEILGICGAIVIVELPQ
jgi:hypothetical protein